MSVNQSVDLLAFGLLVVGLNLVGHRIAPDFAGTMLFFLITGGLMIMLLGVLGLRGWHRRNWPILTVILIAGLLVVQAVRAWLAVKSDVTGLKPIAVILSLLLFFAIMQLMDFVRTACDLPAKNWKSANITTKDTAVAGDAQKLSLTRLDE